MAKENNAAEVAAAIKGIEDSPTPGTVVPPAGDRQEDPAVEDAARRQEWLKSDEHRRLLRAFWLFTAAGLIIIAVGALSTAVSGPHERVDYLFGGLGGLIFGVYVVGFGYSIRKSQLRRQFDDRIILSKARSDLQQAENEVVTGESTDFLSLWNVTQKRLSYYHDIATAHSERSFLYGQIAAASGFIVLLTGAAIAAFTTTIAGAIAAAIAGISGGGLGAFIGATFMRSQDVAAEQMREYFRQPLEFSKFLAAERLLDSLDGEVRAKATQAIIESMIKSDYSSKDA